MAEKRNLTMMTDLYQLTMMYGYFRNNMAQNEGIFDMFFRPRASSTYAIMAGVESLVDYIKNLHFYQLNKDMKKSVKLLKNMVIHPVLRYINYV